VSAVPDAQWAASGLRGLPVHRLWEFHHKSYLGAPPVPIGRFLALVDRKGRVLFLDPNSGSLEAEAKTKSTLDSPPVWDASRFYVVSVHPRKRLQAHEFAGGKRLWRKSFRQAPQPPIRVGEAIWLPVRDTIYRIDPENGAITGTVVAGDQIWLTPIPFGAQFALLGRSGVLRMIDSTGTVRSETDLGGHCEYPPAARSDALFVVTAEGALIKLGADGQVHWRTDLDLEGLLPPAPQAEITYVAGAGGGLWAVDDTSGEQVWHRDLKAPAAGAPLPGDRWLASTTIDGTLWLLDRQSGATLDSVHFGAIVQEGPVWAFGRLYVVASDKTLYAFGTSP
jgi:outer membrane protein assembly factor BamB